MIPNGSPEAVPYAHGMCGRKSIRLRGFRGAFPGVRDILTAVLQVTASYAQAYVPCHSGSTARQKFCDFAMEAELVDNHGVPDTRTNMSEQKDGWILQKDGSAYN